MLKIADRLNELMIINNVDSKTLAKAISKSTTTIYSWCKQETLMLLSSALSIADYFNCSIEYLIGRTDTLLDYTPVPCPAFYDRFREVLKQHNITRYKFIKETRFEDEHFTKWKNGSDPSLISLVDVADYIGCTVDYLVGRDN